MSIAVSILFGVPAKPDRKAEFRPFQFPGISVAQPQVGDFPLPAVMYFLIENAVLVTNAVANGRNLPRSQGIQIARRQTSEPAVTESGLLFLRQDLFKIKIKSARDLAGIIAYTQIDQIVGQVGPEKKLGREITHGAGAGLFVLLGRFYPTV